MKKFFRTFLIPVLALNLNAGSGFAAAHPCVQQGGFERIEKCFEALGQRERIIAFRDSIDELAPMLNRDFPFFSIQLADQSAKMTKEDAVPLYREIQRI